MPRPTPIATLATTLLILTGTLGILATLPTTRAQTEHAGLVIEAPELVEPRDVFQVHAYATEGTQLEPAALVDSNLGPRLFIFNATPNTIADPFCLNDTVDDFTWHPIGSGGVGPECARGGTFASGSANVTFVEVQAPDVPGDYSFVITYAVSSGPLEGDEVFVAQQNFRVASANQTVEITGFTTFDVRTEEVILITLGTLAFWHGWIFAGSGPWLAAIGSQFIDKGELTYTFGFAWFAMFIALEVVAHRFGPLKNMRDKVLRDA